MKLNYLRQCCCSVSRAGLQLLIPLFWLPRELPVCEHYHICLMYIRFYLKLNYVIVFRYLRTCLIFFLK